MPSTPRVKLGGGDASVSPRVPSNDRSTTDWMLNREFFLELSSKFGPFTCDACCDDRGANAHVSTLFFSPSNSFMDNDIAGMNVYMNPPFDNVLPFITHYVKAKVRDPSTSGVFVLPHWPSAPWFSDVSNRFQLIRQSS